MLQRAIEDLLVNVCVCASELFEAMQMVLCGSFWMIIVFWNSILPICSMNLETSVTVHLWSF